MKTALIHYFSGTGNTYHAVKCLGEMLSEADYKIEYLNMEEDTRKDNNSYHLHIFAFCVYGFGVPAFVKKYLNRLQPVFKGKACIISIGGQTGKGMGAFEGDALSKASSILKRKGFDILLTELLGYPENWTQFFNPPNNEIQAVINDEQDRNLIAIADKIIADISSLRKAKVLSQGLSKIVCFAYSNIGRRFLGKFFIADKHCNGCGKCSRICPVHNIKMHKQVPMWRWHCEGCQRCINACPPYAIQTSSVRLLTLMALQILPIFLVISFNKRLPVNPLLDILLYLGSTLVLTLAADWTMHLLEQLPFTQRLLQLSFTKNFRRYLSKDINIK